ncbi:lipase family protein [Allorhodopirellula heiligendammensis]|nr:lipase family protein [Allorhodopirellula heiligendammensis]
MFNDFLDGDEAPRVVREGKNLRVAGWVNGPWSERPAPDLTVFADINFDGDFDDDGEMVRFKSGEFGARSKDYGLYDQYSGFDAYFSIIDDGISEVQNGVPGNNTPSDDVEIRIEFTGELIEKTAEVNNVQPLFTSRPSVTTETASNGSKLLVVSSALWDPGVMDRHHVSVKWADGTTSNATDESTTVDPVTLEYLPTKWKIIRVARPMPTDGQPLYPITVTLHDDDKGDTSYLIQTSDVSRNNDDDNTNGIEDLFEGGFVLDDDVVALELSSITGDHVAAANQPVEDPPAGDEPPQDQGASEPEGNFYLGYDTQQIKLWDSREKNIQYTPGEQKDVDHPYTGESDVWIEGIGVGTTRITLSWQPSFGEDEPPDFEQERNILLGHINVTVWGIDLDIDSDNNNGFNYPDNSEWEEYIEDSEYGIGKLVYPDASHFVPVRLRLPAGLNLERNASTISFDFEAAGASGVVNIWNVAKAATRMNMNIHEGGNRIYAHDSYSLTDLNYDPGTGGITVFVQGADAFPRHAKKKGIDDAGKPDDRIKVILSLPGTAPLADEVKYMVVDVGTFYPNLQDREQLRNAMASEGVYEQADLPQFALRLISEAELRELGMSWSITQLIGEPESVPGFKNAIYLDYVSRAYVLAFAGTDDYDDILVDVWQGIGGFTEQYQAAMDIGFEFARVAKRVDADHIVTGHSLGGGLASAAAVVGNFRADTFNAAGLMESTLFERDQDGVRIEGLEQFPGSVERFRNPSMLIDAYYLDWDILSFVQDYSPAVIPSAIGRRYKMDGPVDAQLAGVGIVFLASKLIPGAGWVNVASELGASAYYMGLSHTTLYYQHGLMVDESTGWDIHGYDL